MPRKSRERRKRTGWRRLIPTWRITLLGLAASVLLGVGLFALGIALVRVPDAHAAATAQSNTWLYSDGSVLARTGQTNRQNVPLDKVSPAAQHAALAAEDRNFYSEGAVNFKGMARAAFNTASGGATQGGSTITQQYVKNAYLNQKQTVSRKVKEVFIAIKVDATQSKDDILSSYLNTSYYGRGAYGIQAAAQAYFGVDASQLTAAQGAYLATLLNAPSAFDVSSAGEAAKQKAVARWNYVMDGMVAKKWLGAEERQSTAFPEVLAPKSAPGLSGQAGYLVAAATSYLTDQGIVSDAQLAQGGYTITLTVDSRKQQQLQDAVQAQLTDNLKPDSRKVDAAAQAGAVSVDPKTGQVLALYGGADATKHWVDNATRTDYQAGSTFKAIALAAALDSGARTQYGDRINANTVYDGTNRRPVRGAKGVPYAPPNEGERSYGQITLQQATDWSVNSVFAQLAQDTGLEKVRATAVALGLPADTPDLKALASIPLGTSTPSALNLAGVYATLDNDGQQITPWLVKGLESGGEQVALPEHRATQAISKDAARATTSILQGVVDDQGGTGYRAAALNRPAAGKTGTTDESRSVWFAGYTPELVTVVGLFGQEPGTGKQVSLDGVGGAGNAAGGKFPAQIWTAYMKSALAGQPVSDFAGPSRSSSVSTPSAAPSSSASPSQSPSATDPATDPATPTGSASPTTGSRPSDGGAQQPSRTPSARPSGGAGRSPSASTGPALGGAGGLLGDQYQPSE
ncbi:transglycosylase domain-containing protein [Streptomyces sp. TLI_171]|uniref:transglycosylase domain-containing protein n=1 Tax=Streptomyces sp. TLI_171 TaxID=1938859 RepID=UPI000C1A2983|nr:transglycosylase domain-containing protein [Streptomyces sp. TLI_171]RKE19194.1 membrane peptidoglycan carboxypeptidase [Streptomyces sp. TLI_171]